MEGYFVRTLGMHRVYNSAFMNMLRDEDNAKYRRVMKNTLEFDPEILKRYVNFMNNPDERTAIDQFGTGDKYFGVCTMLATLPGLPMVGHGQIEGFTEKYGMEYRRAYYDETPREELVERHRREIFPLFRRRALFAEVKHFLLFDFFRPEGQVDENVFAYVNGTDAERVLVVYHNKYAETRGWIRISASAAGKTGRTLAEGLAVPDDPESWIVFRDRAAGLEYVRNAGDLAKNGLFLELAAYKYAVFTDFHEVPAGERAAFARIAAELNGKGVPHLEAAARERWRRPVQAAFRELLDCGFLLEGRREKRGGTRWTASDAEAAAGLEGKARRLARAAAEAAGRPGGEEAAGDFSAGMRSDFEAVLRLADIAGRTRKSGSKSFAEALRYIKSGLDLSPAAGKRRRRPGSRPHASRFRSGLEPRSAWFGLLGWAAFRAVGRLADGGSTDKAIEDWGLEHVFAEAVRDAGLPEADQAVLPKIVRALAARPLGFESSLSVGRNALRLAETIFGDERFRRALRVNEYQGVEYFHQESFDVLRWFAAALAALDGRGGNAGALPVRAKLSPRESRAVSRAYAAVDLLRKAERQSGFETAKLLARLRINR